MSAAKSFLGRGSLAAAILVASISTAVAADVSSQPNNVVALTGTQVPTLDKSAIDAVNATGANDTLSKVDVKPYAPELDDIATLQRQKQMLKLQVEVAQLKGELATAKYQAEHPGSSSNGNSGSSTTPAASTPPVSVNDILAPSWGVASIQGVGKKLTATLSKGSREIQVSAGQNVRGLGRVRSIRVNGVDVVTSSGSSFLPFSSAN